MHWPRWMRPQWVNNTQTNKTGSMSLLWKFNFVRLAIWVIKVAVCLPRWLFTSATRVRIPSCKIDIGWIVELFVTSETLWYECLLNFSVKWAGGFDHCLHDSTASVPLTGPLPFCFVILSPVGGEGWNGGYHYFVVLNVRQARVASVSAPLHKTPTVSGCFGFWLKVLWTLKCRFCRTGVRGGCEWGGSL